jgi:hypothetical protein
VRKSHGSPELLVVGELKAEGHVGGLWGKADFAPRLWEKAERMMLVVAAKAQRSPCHSTLLSVKPATRWCAHRVLVVVDSRFTGPTRVILKGWGAARRQRCISGMGLTHRPSRR